MKIDTIRKVHTVRVCNGSGVIVRPLDKSFIYILTNYHVLFDNDGKIKDLKFKFEIGSSLNTDKINVIESPIYCKDKDIAIIKIDAKGFENIEFLRLNTCCDSANIHVGFPKARYNESVSLTMVLNIKNSNGYVNECLIEYEYDNLVNKDELEGMSGGGIFDENYHLVGIHKQSSNIDGNECLGKACFIPIACYKELLQEAGWSPIMEFNLDNFVELTSIAFNFDDRYIWENAKALLFYIDSYKSRIEKLSPVNVINILKDKERLDKSVVIDELSRDFWIDFTEFVIAMVILLDINIKDQQEDFIISVFDRFHFVFSKKQFDFFDVREELDIDMLKGMNSDARLIVGGMKEPSAFNACVLNRDIPNISKARIIDAMDITRHKKQLLNTLTIVNCKIFKKGVPHILDEENPNLGLDHYKNVILTKIDSKK